MANGSKVEAESLPAHQSGPGTEQLDPYLFRRLPSELVEQVGMYMVSDDIHETARRLDDFRTFSPHANAVAKTSSRLNRVQARIHYLRSLANDHYAAVVKEELPEVQREVFNVPRELEPVPAVDHVQAVGPILKLRSSAENSDLVTKILAIPDSVVRSETISAMTPYFDDVAKNDRSSLIKEAIRILGDRGHPLTRVDFEEHGAEGYSINIEGRHEAADVVVESRARGYLTKEHLSDLFDLTTHWPELSGLLARREKERRESIRTQLREAGANMTAVEVLKSDSSALKTTQTSRMTGHFSEIGPEALSALIDNAITTFARMDVPVEWKVRKQAVDVLVEARAGGYLTKDHKSELNSVTRANPELKQALSKGMESHKKYAVDKASDAEIANLRKTFDDVKNVNLPSLDVARLPAEHARMDSLQRVSKAVEKSSTMLRQQLRDANRERSGPVR
ncbi:hypothetical protein [Rhizobium nepotum]|uniref:Bartonella effector protein BID domain-containing protein n=1 Tax=Rhizobium nepotum 39/7 TaxID=1368418 RepID=A0ABR5CKR2_9HYPH|nr:hypothetical protein [Rhizobium nepotum]KJF65182.1 hypothetical protein RS75_24640 [Rhizobium nepotum 39/7]